MTKYIAVVSGKGGLGKTSFVINIASAFESFSYSSIIVDLHLKKPNVGLYLGYMNPPKTSTSALLGKHKLHEAIYQHPSGIQLIPGDIEKYNATITTEKIADALLDILNKTQIVLVDTPELHESEPILRACDSVILLTQANLVAVSETLKAIQLCKKLHKPILGAVVMQSRRNTFDLNLKDIEATLHIPIIGEIPFDIVVEHAHSLKHPVVYAHDASPASIAYKKLAANLIGQQYEHSVSETQNFWTFLKKRIGFD
jgi:septum site-determining protein MinD